MKVLLVDDSRSMRTILRAVLAQLGFTEIEEAGDGLEAMEKVKSGAHGLMLVDWNMPNMDGLTFVKAFRQGDRRTPIVMVTTECEKARVMEAIAAGVNSYVVKPFTPDLLAQRIKETIAKCKAAAG